MMQTLAGLLAAALYVGATVAVTRDLRRGHAGRRGVLTLAVAALIAHALVLQGAILGPGGLFLGFFNALALAAWVIVLLMVLLALTQPVTNLGTGLFPIAALAVLAALAFPPATAGPTIPARAPGLDLHVLLSICAYGVLALAAMQSIVLGVQQRLLHEHHPAPVLRALPPLYIMETLLFRMIGVGFLLLTLALASGFVYLQDMFAQHLVHKTVLTLSAWVLFGVLLGGHHLSGWRGPTAVRFTLGAFALLVLGYFGSKLVLELVLQRA